MFTSGFYEKCDQEGVAMTNSNLAASDRHALHKSLARRVELYTILTSSARDSFSFFRSKLSLSDFDRAIQNLSTGTVIQQKINYFLFFQK